jgi:hypothetical protein
LLLEGDATGFGELGTTGAVGIEGIGATGFGDASIEELGTGAWAADDGNAIELTTTSLLGGDEIGSFPLFGSLGEVGVFVG